MKYMNNIQNAMKLAEALNERSDVRDRISRLSNRLQNNSKVAQGTEPLEDPKRMLEDLNVLVSRYEELTVLINTANASTKASDGRTLVSLIAKRDSLLMKVETINDLIDSVTTKDHFISKDAPQMVPTVDVRSLRRESDMLSKEARETDALIQATNWTTEV